MALKQQLETIRATSVVVTEEPMFVSQYPAGQMLTQSYMSGRPCVPVNFTSDSFLESAVTMDDVATTEDEVPTPRTVQTLIADLEVKLAKLRLKLS